MNRTSGDAGRQDGASAGVAGVEARPADANPVGGATGSGGVGQTGGTSGTADASGTGGMMTVTSDSWPCFGRDPQHTRLSPVDTSADAGVLKWSFTTGDYVISSPAIGADGTVYVGSYDGRLYAIH